MNLKYSYVKGTGEVTVRPMAEPFLDTDIRVTRDEARRRVGSQRLFKAMQNVARRDNTWVDRHDWGVVCAVRGTNPTTIYYLP